MTRIGDSIYEAIDWTQDLLCTTRPLAERTLFSLLADGAVEETEDGFILHEAEEEVEKRHQTARHHFTKNWRRYRFHAKRKNAKQRFATKKMEHLDSSDAADEMWEADDESSPR